MGSDLSCCPRYRDLTLPVASSHIHNRALSVPSVQAARHPACIPLACTAPPAPQEQAAAYKEEQHEISKAMLEHPAEASPVIASASATAAAAGPRSRAPAVADADADAGTVDAAAANWLQDLVSLLRRPSA